MSVRSTREKKIAKKKQRQYLDRNRPHFRFIHQHPRVDWPKVEPGTTRWKGGEEPHGIWHEYFRAKKCELCTYLLTQWSTFLLENLTGSQLVKKFPTFYGTRRFIAAFTSARHLSLSGASSIQSIPLNPTSWMSILILSSHLRLGLSSGLFPSGFSTKTLYTPLLSHIRATCFAYLILINFITRAILGEQYRSLSSSLFSFLHSPCYLVPPRPRCSPRHPTLKHPQPESHVPFPLLTPYQIISPGLKLSVWMFRNNIRFYGEKLLTPRPNPKLEGHPFSAVRDCLFNIFAATIHIGSKLRTRHAVVTGTHLSRKCELYKKVYCYVHIVCYLWRLFSEAQQINWEVRRNLGQRQLFEDTSLHERVLVVLNCAQQMSRESQCSCALVSRVGVRHFWSDHQPTSRERFRMKVVFR